MRLNGTEITRVELQAFAAQARERARAANCTQARKAYEAAAVFAERESECVNLDPPPVCRFGQGDYRRDWM